MFSGHLRLSNLLEESEKKMLQGQGCLFLTGGFLWSLSRNMLLARLIKYSIMEIKPFKVGALLFHVVCVKNWVPKKCSILTWTAGNATHKKRWGWPFSQPFSCKGVTFSIAPRPLSQWSGQAAALFGECSASYLLLVLLCWLFWWKRRLKHLIVSKDRDWSLRWWVWLCLKAVGDQDQKPHLCSTWEACNVWRGGDMKNVWKMVLWVTDLE